MSTCNSTLLPGPARKHRPFQASLTWLTMGLALFGLALQVQAQQAEAPALLLPQNNDTLATLRPSFQWMALAPDQRGTYVFRLVERQKGQDGRLAFMQNPDLIQTSGLGKEYFSFPLGTAGLKPGRWYAWQVTKNTPLRIGDRETTTEANSDVFSFYVKVPPKQSLCNVKVQMQNPGTGFQQVSGNVVYLETPASYPLNTLTVTLELEGGKGRAYSVSLERELASDDFLLDLTPMLSGKKKATMPRFIRGRVRAAANASDDVGYFRIMVRS